MVDQTRQNTLAPVPLTEPVSILMPVCNEADIIQDVLEEWIEKVIRFLPPGSELVLDDASNDGTEKILARMAERQPFIKVNYSKRDGFFNSAIRLYNLAQCPLVFFTDSDGQYVPEEFWKVAAHIHEFDMVHGAKIDRQDPFYRVRASFVFNALIRWWFASKCVDVNSAFRLVRLHVVKSMIPKICHLRMLPNAELYIRAEAAQFSIKNVPITHRQRKFGKSRSLPLMVFAIECWRAFTGLTNLRKELRSPKVDCAILETSPKDLKGLVD